LVNNLSWTHPERTVDKTMAPHTNGAVTVRNAASFQLLEEKDTSSFQEIHIPHGWTKLRLVFTTSDRLAHVQVEDDGGAVTIRVTGPNCFSISRYYQYGERNGESHLYDGMYRTLRQALPRCRVPNEVARDYLRQLRRARADFPAAMQMMKSRALLLFHTLGSRCRTEDVVPMSPDPFRRCP
jgi:hypothetical protein